MLSGGEILSNANHTHHVESSSVSPTRDVKTVTQLETVFEHVENIVLLCIVDYSYSIIITVALGTSKPTSIIVVDTNKSIFLFLKSRITCSFSAIFILP